MLERAFQDLNRLRQIAAAMARHGFGAYLARSRLRDVLGRDAPPVPEGEPLPGPDRSTAERFRKLLAELGPTFIKLGQLLSTRPDLLPAHWIEELEALQDQCPPLPAADIRREIERGLGRPVRELFANLEEVPLASASIAQVHLATTHGGERVVVKVQRPRIRDRVESDLTLLYYLATLLEAVIEDTGIHPTGVVEEFDRTVHEELDFSNEARNASTMREASRGRDFVVIPRVHEELSSSTILTLDYVEGTKISEVSAEAGFEVEQVAKNIIELAFRQLFEDGLFHGDPHPGNILVLPGNRLALLDFGLVGRLSRIQQEALVTMIVAVALRDPDSVARIMNRIGVPEAHTPIAEFREDIRHILDRYLGLKLDEIRTATLLRDLLDLAVRHRIRIPKEYAVLAKAAITVEGIIRRLYPKLDVLEVGLPYAKELLLARFNPSDASSTLMKSLLKIQSLTEDVPAQLTQILVDLEGGKFRVNVHSQDLDRVGAQVRALGVMLCLTILAAGLTVGGLVVLAIGSRIWLGAVAIGAAVAMSASAALYHVATIRMRKISLWRLLRR